MTHHVRSLYKVFLSAICFCGLQFGWALQIALLTPFILELGIDRMWVTFVWFCGPVAGLVVQPVVGIMSDKCSSSYIGKRRPFILFGTIGVIFSLILIPCSMDIGYYIFNQRNTGIHEPKPVAIAITIIGFWILDISNNIVQGPSRAMLADLASSDELQPWANSFVTFWLAVGNIAGYLTGFVDWNNISSALNVLHTSACMEACTNLRLCFAVGSLILFITSLITLTVANDYRNDKSISVLLEENYNQQDDIISSSNTVDQCGDDQKKPQSRWKFILSLICMPKMMFRVCIATFFSWFSWFTFLIYITNWMAEIIFQAKPNDSRFAEGVRYGSLGLAFFSLTSLLSSFMVAILINRFSYKTVWLIGQATLTIALLLTLVIRSVVGGIILIALFGIPWSICLTVPFSITGVLIPEDNRGVFMGILNIFVVIPQLLLASIGPAFVLIGNIINVHPILITFTAGAFFSLLGFFFIVFFIPFRFSKRYTQTLQHENNAHHDSQQDFDESTPLSIVGFRKKKKKKRKSKRNQNERKEGYYHSTNDRCQQDVDDTDGEEDYDVSVSNSE